MSLYASITENGRPHELKSLKLVSRLLQEHGTEHIGFSFNGGKDCTVLLHLIRAAVQQLHPVDDVTPGSPRPCALRNIDVLYFEESEEFPEMEEFMKLISKRHSTKIHRLRGRIKQALTDFLDPRDIRAIFLGQRRVDPDSKHIAEVAPSDRGYPKFDRVNPILDWSHSDVWRFLRTYDLEYCPIYDLGYTSAGPQSRTLRNPGLVVNCALQTYLPAYSLADTRLERYGRPWGRRKLESKNGIVSASAAIIACSPVPFSSVTTEPSVSSNGDTSSTHQNGNGVHPRSAEEAVDLEEGKETNFEQPPVAHHHCQIESLSRQLTSFGVTVNRLVYLQLNVSQCCIDSISDATHTNLAEEEVPVLCKSLSAFASGSSDNGSQTPSRASTDISHGRVDSESNGILESPRTSYSVSIGNGCCDSESKTEAAEKAASSAASDQLSSDFEPSSDVPHEASSSNGHAHDYVPSSLFLSRTRASCVDSNHTFRESMEKDLGETCLCQAFSRIQKHASALMETHNYVYVCGEPVPEPRPASQ